MTQPELLAELKRLNKRANQRLLRLENMMGTEVKTNYAYYHAQEFNDERTNRKSPKNRFYSSPNSTIQQLQREYKHVNRFLNSVMSTKKGIKEQIKKVETGLQTTFDIQDKDLNQVYNLFSNVHYRGVAGRIDYRLLVSRYNEFLEKGENPEVNEFLVDMIYKYGGSDPVSLINQMGLQTYDKKQKTEIQG